MKKHIIILKKGNVCYGSTSYFAERINEEFKKTGISSEIVDINSKEDAERFVQKYERLNEVTDIIDFNTDIFHIYFPKIIMIIIMQIMMLPGQNVQAAA